MLVKVREQKEKAQARYAHLRDLVTKQQFLEEEHKEISVQLVQGKPIVTEMLNFVNQKATNEDPTVQMTNLINDISDSLTQTEDQAQLFGRAAMFSSTASSKPF